jgi:hypothetical protein
MALRRVLLAAFLVAGCATASPPTPAPGLQLPGDQFARTGGCGNAFLFAATEDDRALIVIEWPNAASEAQLEGGYTDSASLPADNVRVRLQLGSRLSEGMCTDIIMPDAPLIETDVDAQSGQVEITVTPDAADPIFPLARADLILTDVVFTVEAADGPQTYRLDRLELTDISIGWMAG